MEPPRPYLRALHGLLITLWRLDHHEAATRVARSML